MVRLDRGLNLGGEVAWGAAARPVNECTALNVTDTETWLSVGAFGGPLLVRARGREMASWGGAGRGGSRSSGWSTSR